MKKVVIILSILLCISVGLNVYLCIKVSSIKDNVVKELAMQTLDVRLDTNLTDAQFIETINEIKSLQNVSKVENIGSGIVFVDIIDISKYGETKKSILKINGVNNIIDIDK